MVEDVSPTARPGEVIGLVGPNGSGKSSLLRAVYRVLRPTTGQVGVDGTDAWSLPVRQLARTVAAAVQESGADFDLTVREVVAMARARRGHHHAVVSARCVRADPAGPAGSWWRGARRTGCAGPGGPGGQDPYGHRTSHRVAP
ncbi:MULTISPECIES: ATP-binding cassette domain-containing protein [Streptomyces]|uniref:ATP-binding cassette domain-containing protein n=1 Tax=Streptomyces TaxID=1883 RepID=UPI003988FC2A